jgi:hypothetical protein
MTDEQDRATTAISMAELHGLMTAARDPQEPRLTEGIAPVVIIVDRPARVVDGLVQRANRAATRVVTLTRFRALKRPVPRTRRPLGTAGGVAVARRWSSRDVATYVALAATACVWVWLLA